MNASNPESGIILIGIGNDGRRDDGLGWRFAEALAGNPGLDIEFRYQLQVEDAERIARYPLAVFVDAARDPLPGGFSLDPCIPAPDAGFSTHRLDPEAVAWLAQTVFGARTECYILAISGYRWELRGGLTSRAQANLQRALEAFRNSGLIAGSALLPNYA